jgi:hypothetical protein
MMTARASMRESERGAGGVEAQRGSATFIGRGRERTGWQGKGRCWWSQAIMAMMCDTLGVK